MVVGDVLTLGLFIGIFINLVKKILFCGGGNFLGFYLFIFLFGLILVDIIWVIFGVIWSPPLF
jgi:hypothetical protein